MPVGDDHETRISRLEFRMDIVADKQERDAGERKEDHAEVMRELKALRAETNRQQGAKEQRAANLKVAGIVIGVLGLFVALGWMESAEAALKRGTENESHGTKLVIENSRTLEPR